MCISESGQVVLTSSKLIDLYVVSAFGGIQGRQRADGPSAHDDELLLGHCVPRCVEVELLFSRREGRRVGRINIAEVINRMSIAEVMIRMNIAEVIRNMPAYLGLTVGFCIRSLPGMHRSS